jgi:basic membrane lipoprotein Med (substrate-binding protein (PBP1-ABC) superfamily)
MDVAVYAMIRALVRGTFTSGRSAVYDLADGGVGLGKVSPKVPRALLVQVERVRRQIVAGTLGPIPTTVSR